MAADRLASTSKQSETGLFRVQGLGSRVLGI